MAPACSPGRASTAGSRFWGSKANESLGLPSHLADHSHGTAGKWNRDDWIMWVCLKKGHPKVPMVDHNSQQFPYFFPLKWDTLVASPIFRKLLVPHFSISICRRFPHHGIHVAFQFKDQPTVGGWLGVCFCCVCSFGWWFGTFFPYIYIYWE